MAMREKVRGMKREMKEKTIMNVDTVSLNPEHDAVVIIDQTKLPGKVEQIFLRSPEEIWQAIYLLKVRGAPAIGVTAAFGIYLLAKQALEQQIAKNGKEDADAFFDEFYRQKKYLDSARPTAVNLSWALNRMALAAEQGRRNGDNLQKILELLRQEAETIRNEDIFVCKKIGEHGLKLLKKGDGILTHCNAGKLAAVRYGTATAPIYLGQEAGYDFKVFCDETRPLLQGARLTAYELHASGIDTTLICDNMSAEVMKKGWIQAVLVGCDRVAANGDTANKIGTSVVAAIAKQYGIPFYVCAPTSTIDMQLSDGEGIVIEERSPGEVTEMWYQNRMAPEGIRVFNPAFDVTDHSMITGIVTEYGVARAPYEKSLREIFQKKEDVNKTGQEQ